ncbi:MAG: NAD(P)-dependent oxidoreductase [Bacteroidota bacterium]
MKIGIIKEGKTPPDSRVALTPAQCKAIKNEFQLDIIVQPSPTRCFPDEDYLAAGIPLSDNLSGCDILMGVKEVPISQLIGEKTYFFFSHTIKEQAYNQQLLWSVLEKNIRLIDYEVLTNENGQRLIAFGKFAGMVGAHNGLWTYGQRSGVYQMPRMSNLLDYEEAKSFYQTLSLPPVKIVLTGTGRVANGAALVLRDMGIQQVNTTDFLTKTVGQAIFTQLDCEDYAARKDGSDFDLHDFFQHPHLYKSIFAPYAKVADIMINGIYWDNRAPAFFSLKEMAETDFSIQVIADVTCDIAPVSSIPSTIQASTIANPVFGFDPSKKIEIPAFSKLGIDMMTIDNLPNELPRDASKAFGEQFMTHILPELLKDKSEVIDRATITLDGVLGPHFQYLADYAAH